MKRISVSLKLLASFLGLTLIAVSLGLYAVWSLMDLSRIAIDTYDKPLMATSYARAAALDAERLRTNVKAYSEAAPMRTGSLYAPATLAPGGYDPIATGSIGAAEPSARFAVSERRRLLAFARAEKPASERQRLLMKLGRQPDVSVKSARNPFSERQRLVSRARTAPRMSERASLIAQARKEVLVAMASSQEPAKPAEAPEQSAASPSADEAEPVKVAKAQPETASPTAQVEQQQNESADTANTSNEDRAAQREKISEYHELMIENLEVVEERAFTKEISAAVADSLSLAKAWADENKQLFQGEDVSSISGAEKLDEIVDSIEALVEQTVAAGFEYRSEAKELANSETRVLLILVAISVVLALVLALGTARFVVAPLKRAISAIGALADGDLSVELKVKSRDEVGDLANAVTVLRTNLKERNDLQAAMQSEEEKNKHARVKARQELADRFKAKFEEVVESITLRMEELQNTAGSLTRNAEDASGRATHATESTTNTANNVNNVASATQELSASIGEIEEKVSHTAKIVSEAAGTALESDSKISGLVSAVEKIGNVVDLIRDVTEQTNLLALNATIEAARAGEAGKGFAVVAQEVKTLAGQTAKATEEIVQQIQAIQGSTGEAAEAIRSVTEAVNHISEYTSGIASAVQQQTAATQEIAQSVDEAASGTSQTSESMGNLVKSTNDTARAAVVVSDASERATADAIRLKDAVDDFVRDLTAA